MAFSSAVLRAIILALALAHLHFSSCHLVKGSVSCLDCAPRHDLSGVRVAVECNHESKPAVTALTNAKGCFEVELPFDFSPPSSPSSNCLARLLGGPKQFWSFNKSMVSRLVEVQGVNYYTLSSPLTFLSSPLPKAKGLKTEKPHNSPQVGSSKTIDIPLPPEWGFAPSSYYAYPFIPIIVP